MALEKISRSGMISCKPYSIGDVLPLHNLPERLPKQIYDEKKHQSFESSIRRHVKARSELKQEK